MSLPHGDRMAAAARAVRFAFHACRFGFEALESLFFPAGKAGNIVRGALGSSFRQLACAPDCPGARTCEQRAVCAYARLFEPTACAPGPSGLADWPRPFVLRAAHLDGQVIRPGESFQFDVHLFTCRKDALAILVLAFAQLAEEGLGPRRGRATLRRVYGLDASGQPRHLVYDPIRAPYPCVPPPLVLSLQPLADSVRRVRVQFLTPTELKGDEQLVREPHFGVLFARIRDRISTLPALYGEGPLDIDFRAMADSAARVRLISSRLRSIGAERRSGRTGQIHPLGGFVGEAEYEGNLAEFVPYLEAAYWTGVGRQTVWGKGVVRIQARHGCAL